MRVLTGLGVVATPVAAILVGIPVPWLVAAGCAVAAGLLLRSAMFFYRQAHPDFPRHGVDIGRPWYLDVADDISGQERYVLVQIRYTNQDPNRPVNLAFEILTQRVVDDQVLKAPSLSATDRGRIGQIALPVPFKVPPLDTQSGAVAFDARGGIALVYHDGQEVALRRHFRAVLGITDYASGAVLDLPLDFAETS